MLRLTCTTTHLITALRRLPSRKEAELFLTTTGQHLTLTLVDGTLRLASHCPAQISAHDTLTLQVQPRQLQEILQTLPQHTPLTLAADSIQCHLSADTLGWTSRLPTTAAPDQPPVPHWEDSISLPGGQLAQALKRTAFAIAKPSEARRRHIASALFGMLWKIEGTCLTCVATDGHRLAQDTLILDQPVATTQRLVIPAQTISELQRLLRSAKSETITCRWTAPTNPTETAPTVQISSPDFTLESACLPYTFPPYEAVPLPPETRYAIIPRETLQLSLKRLLALTQGPNHGIRWVSSPQGLTLSPTAAIGSTEEQLPVQHQGQPITISFNARLALDILEHIPTPHVRLIFPEPDGKMPSVWRPDLDHQESASQYLLMPLRLNSERS